MRLFRHVVVFIALICGWLVGPGPARADLPASYQAATWDKEITLPAKAYRAVKPIELNGGFDVKTQPGTLLDGVVFQARGDRQHYHAEGTLFRHCRFLVKMGGSGHFIESALEDGDFHKDDAWFVAYWSTRWRFENCVFTKRFVRGELPPVDYAVHATRCTVYGAKLPPVGFKDDPAKYMGKEDLVFEKCRFVDCDVPQSFLACTADCVFEGCRFEPRGKPVWPKETTAIKVHAYFAAGGTEPVSFVNGPLSVEFERAPQNGEFGSTVPHSQSGGRIMLTKLPASDRFVQLGTVPRKASEIVDPLAALAEASSPAPAATPRVAATAAPALATPTPPVPAAAATPDPAATGEIRSVEAVLRTLPYNVEVLSKGLPNPRGLEAANAFLTKNCVGRAAALKMTLASTQALADGKTYQANDRWQGVLHHGATIQACAVATFRGTAAAPLAKIQPQTDFAVRGVVTKAEFTARGDALFFVVSVGEANVLDSLAALSRPAPAPPVPAGNAAAAAVVGVWTAFTRPAGTYQDQTHNADHSVFVGGQRVGTWEITGRQFIVRFDGAGVDTYELPGRDGLLRGTNQDAGPLLAKRQGVVNQALEANIPAQYAYHINPGKDRVLDFQADHTYTEKGKMAGHWLTVDNILVTDWTEHPDWHDWYTLPEENGVISGTDKKNHQMTLTRTNPATVAEGVKKPPTSYFGDAQPP